MTTFHGFEFLATILSKRAQQLWDSWIVYGWTRLAKHIPSKNLALFPQTCRNNLGVSTLFPPAFTSFAEFSTVVIDECFFFFPMAGFFLFGILKWNIGVLKILERKIKVFLHFWDCVFVDYDLQFWVFSHTPFIFLRCLLWHRDK